MRLLLRFAIAFAIVLPSPKQTPFGGGREDKVANQQITHQRLTEVLQYEPATGHIAWRDGRTTVVGHRKETGHVRVVIDGVRYAMARLCWFYVHQQWPAHVIDHINGDPSDNRLANLRDVQPAVNNQNRRRPHRNSKTGAMGVIARGDGFHVAMSFMGKPLTLRGSKTKDEAQHLYVELKRRLHDGFVEVQS